MFVAISTAARTVRRFLAFAAACVFSACAGTPQIVNHSFMF